MRHATYTVLLKYCILSFPQYFSTFVFRQIRIAFILEVLGKSAVEYYSRVLYLDYVVGIYLISTGTMFGRTEVMLAFHQGLGGMLCHKRLRP